MIPDIESYFRGDQREARFADGASALEEKLQIRFPDDYRNALTVRGSWSFDGLDVRYCHPSFDIAHHSLTDLLAVPPGDWPDRLAQPDTGIDGPGICNGFRVLAYLDWVTMGGWWPHLVPIIYSDGFGFLAYDFRYSKDAPPIIAVSYEMFDIPSDPDFVAPTYMADSFESLLRSSERQDPMTGKFPSDGLPFTAPSGAAEWEAKRDEWLSQIEPRSL